MYVCRCSFFVYFSSIPSMGIVYSRDASTSSDIRKWLFGPFYSHHTIEFICSSVMHSFDIIYYIFIELQYKYLKEKITMIKIYNSIGWSNNVNWKTIKVIFMNFSRRHLRFSFFLFYLFHFHSCFFFLMSAFMIFVLLKHFLSYQQAYCFCCVMRIYSHVRQRKRFFSHFSLIATYSTFFFSFFLVLLDFFFSCSHSVLFAANMKNRFIDRVRPTMVTGPITTYIYFFIFCGHL